MLPASDDSKVVPHTLQCIFPQLGPAPIVQYDYIKVRSADNNKTWLTKTSFSEHILKVPKNTALLHIAVVKSDCFNPDTGRFQGPLLEGRTNSIRLFSDYVKVVIMGEVKSYKFDMQKLPFDHNIEQYTMPVRLICWLSSTVQAPTEQPVVAAKFVPPASHQLNSCLSMMKGGDASLMDYLIHASHGETKPPGLPDQGVFLYISEMFTFKKNYENRRKPKAEAVAAGRAPESIGVTRIIKKDTKPKRPDLGQLARDQQKKQVPPGYYYSQQLQHLPSSLASIPPSSHNIPGSSGMLPMSGTADYTKHHAHGPGPPRTQLSDHSGHHSGPHSGHHSGHHSGPHSGHHGQVLHASPSASTLTSGKQASPGLPYHRAGHAVLGVSGSVSGMHPHLLGVGDAPGPETPKRTPEPMEASVSPWIGPSSAMQLPASSGLHPSYHLAPTATPITVHHEVQAGYVEHPDISNVVGLSTEHGARYPSAPERHGAIAARVAPGPPHRDTSTASVGHEELWQGLPGSAALESPAFSDLLSPGIAGSYGRHGMYGRSQAGVELESGLHQRMVSAPLQHTGQSAAQTSQGMVVGGRHRPSLSFDSTLAALDVASIDVQAPTEDAGAQLEIQPLLVQGQQGVGAWRTDRQSDTGRRLMHQDSGGSGDASDPYAQPSRSISLDPSSVTGGSTLPPRSHVASMTRTGPAGTTGHEWLHANAVLKPVPTDIFDRSTGRAASGSPPGAPMRYGSTSASSPTDPSARVPSSSGQYSGVHPVKIEAGTYAMGAGSPGWGSTAPSPSSRRSSGSWTAHQVQYATASRVVTTSAPTTSTSMPSSQPYHGSMLGQPSDRSQSLRAQLSRDIDIQYDPRADFPQSRSPTLPSGQSHQVSQGWSQRALRSDVVGSGMDYSVEVADPQSRMFASSPHPSMSGRQWPVSQGPAAQSPQLPTSFGMSRMTQVQMPQGGRSRSAELQTLRVADPRYGEVTAASGQFDQPSLMPDTDPEPLRFSPTEFDYSDVLLSQPDAGTGHTGPGGQGGPMDATGEGRASHDEQYWEGGSSREAVHGTGTSYMRPAPASQYLPYQPPGGQMQQQRQQHHQRSMQQQQQQSGQLQGHSGGQGSGGGVSPAHDVQMMEHSPGHTTLLEPHLASGPGPSINAPQLSCSSTSAASSGEPPGTHPPPPSTQSASSRPRSHSQEEPL